MPSRPHLAAPLCYDSRRLKVAQKEGLTVASHAQSDAGRSSIKARYPSWQNKVVGVTTTSRAVWIISLPTGSDADGY